MARRVGRIVIAAAAIGAAMLVGNAAVSVYHTAALRNESAAVLRSNELLLALDDVLSLVKDAESGQRGYVITGRAEYLAPYRAAVAPIQARMDALEQLAREDPTQERLMADVRRRVAAKLGELELTVGLRDRKGFDLTRDVIALGAGQAEMEALRATAAGMAAHEAQRLAERQAAADATYRAALSSEALAGLAALAALIGFSIMLARHLRSRDQAEALISAQGERLRVTLESIGDAVIATDLDGRVTNLNRVAESLTGWRADEAMGQPLEAVFRIVNESSPEPVENPATRALHDGVIVGLANHTVLIGKDGAEAPI